MNKNQKKALKKLEKIFFPVHKFSAEDFYQTRGLNYLPHLQSVIIAEHMGQKILVNQCGKDYELITNKMLFTPMVKRLEDEFGEIDVKIKGFDSPSKFFVDFIIFDKAFNVGTKKKVDDIFPRVRVNNSYDGSVKFGYDMGFHRLTCANGASVPVGNKNLKGDFMHTPGLGAGTDEEIQKAVTKLMDTTESFLLDSAELIKGYEPLLEQGYDSFQTAMSRIAEMVEDITYPRKALEVAAGQLQKEINAGHPINDWLIYNAMNYGLYNNSDAKTPVHKLDKVDREILNYLITQ